MHPNCFNLHSGAYHTQLLPDDSLGRDWGRLSIQSLGGRSPHKAAPDPASTGSCTLSAALAGKQWCFSQLLTVLTKDTLGVHLQKECSSTLERCVTPGDASALETLALGEPLEKKPKWRLKTIASAKHANGMWLITLAKVHPVNFREEESFHPLQMWHFVARMAAH